MRIDIVEAGISGQGPAWEGWWSEGKFVCPPVGPYLLAASTPGDAQVSVWDEKVNGPYLYRPDVDLVGISFKTMSADRAYGLADSLRAKGMRVALGGVHASLLPDEASKHGDAVVVGEADDVWPQLVHDAAVGDLKSRYASARRPDITRMPPQRVDLIDQDRYIFHTLQSARGCSLDCEFCPTRHMFGEGFRLRELEVVEEEIQTLLRAAPKPFFFADDVFAAGEPGYMKAIAGAMGNLNARFALIADLQIFSPAVLPDLARGGCMALTLNMPGTCSAPEAQAIRAIRAHGIEVWGYFMFGFEFHGPDVFERCVKFVRDTGMEGVFLTVLAPYAGTLMGERLRSEGRILSDNWAEYDQAHVVSKPLGMSVVELEEGFAWASDQLRDTLGFAKIWERIAQSL